MQLPPEYIHCVSPLCESGENSSLSDSESFKRLADANANADDRGYMYLTRCCNVVVATQVVALPN